MTKPIPEASRGVAPYLCVRGAAAAIDFYKQAFGAVETMRLRQPDGRVGHAELRIAGGVVSLADEFPDFGVLGPQSLGGSAVTLHFYVDDVDAACARAVAAGAKLAKPVTDEFYGDRVGRLTDPFGHVWSIATHKEDVSSEEMQRRLDRLYGQG